MAQGGAPSLGSGEPLNLPTTLEEVGTVMAFADEHQFLCRLIRTVLSKDGLSVSELRKIALSGTLEEAVIITQLLAQLECHSSP